MRAQNGLGSLREPSVFRSLRPAFLAASNEDFRIVHFSVQRDHLHLLVEATNRAALSRGMHVLAIRIARAVNRALRRAGRVFADRYHARDLTTPRAVRNGLVYVLANVRKHLRVRTGLDPCSSAAAFDGWSGDRPFETLEAEASRARAWTSSARTWLLRLGWRRYGPIAVDEAPVARPSG
jgi:REP element-mobilizing transposase RayT